MRRCVALTIAASIAVAASAPPALAAGGSLEDRLPDASAAVAAYSTVRRWVTAFEAPRLDDAQSKIPIGNSTGVCVILRRGGRVVGQATDVAGDDLMVRRAAGKAMAEALSDPALGGIIQGMKKQVDSPDSLPAHDDEKSLSVLGRGLTLELEVAGPRMPLVGRSVQQIGSRVEPGLDGVSLRLGQSWHIVFPSQLRATNMSAQPEDVVLNLAAAAGVPVKDRANLPKRDDVSVYSFRTIHLTQAGPSRLPFQLVRGDTLVGESEVTKDSIIVFADGVAKRLVNSLWPEPPAEESGNDDGSAVQAREPLGIVGDYSIVADQYRPLIAPPLDQALTAMALNRYAQRLPDRPDSAAASEAAARILRDLAQVTTAEDDPLGDPVACAAIVYAVAERSVSLDDGQIRQLYDKAVVKVLGSFDPDAGFIERQSPDGQARRISSHKQAILAGALARRLAMANQPLNDVDAATIRKAIDWVWRSTPQAEHIALLPWIGWAEIDYAQATNRPLDHVDDLRMLDRILAEGRIGSAVRPGPMDLRGGFSLIDPSHPDAAPQATAQSLRPAAWAATSLMQAPLTSPEQAKDALRGQLSTLRFIMQLSIRKSALGSLRNPERALGGVRASLWDSELAVAAQALALITAVDTALAVESLGNR
ncbi:MAG: hypothetical protein L0Y44_01855 [Phycisphaerales bacterium]|nr:hypothetical protein [Phycisphaerales bacterium]